MLCCEEMLAAPMPPQAEMKVSKVHQPSKLQKRLWGERYVGSGSSGRCLLRELQAGVCYFHAPGLEEV